ncbi:MAG: cytochrome d ubiquinol oxidase subunit II [Elusimicrobia bacterium]|nr:cytochrome d ubiquinol oxidase subunit II [Candidatus Obscuribacterium magneticum]
MLALENIAFGLIVFCLAVYALTGGADFGAGFLSLFLRGPRAKEERQLITRAMTPVWEANHVWLIIVVVLLFATFPKAFSAISTALFLPLLLVLLGIILRGAAFVFSAYGSESSSRWWNPIFGLASGFTPFMLGVVIGAVGSGQIHLDPEGHPTSDLGAGWGRLFSIAVGLLTWALTASIGSIYLLLETNDDSLRAPFRKMAFATTILFIALLWLTLGTSVMDMSSYPPLPSLRLESSGLTFLIMSTVGAAILWSLRTGRYQRARILTVFQILMLVWGWGSFQHPFLLYPNLSIANAAAPMSVLKPILTIVLVGTIFLVVPAFGFLYYIFKKDTFRS